MSLSYKQEILSLVCFYIILWSLTEPREINIGDNILQLSLDKADNIKAIGSMLIELIEPSSSFLNAGSLTPIHLNR